MSLWRSDPSYRGDLRNGVCHWVLSGVTLRPLHLECLGNKKTSRKKESKYFFTFYGSSNDAVADPSDRAFKDVGLRPLACWDCGFEPLRGDGCLFLVTVVCCQLEVSASGWSLVQRSTTECGVPECDQESLTMKSLAPLGLFCHDEKKRTMSVFRTIQGVPGGMYKTSGECSLC